MEKHRIFNFWTCLFVFYISTVFCHTDLDKAEQQIIRLLETNETIRNSFNKLFRNHGNKSTAAAFDCPILKPSVPPPTSVHKLSPPDVKVVAAIGDSLTAGRGVDPGLFGIMGLTTDYRGQSWSIGGDEKYESNAMLPNILRKYNPNLYGFSTGDGDRNKQTSKFNVARSGDESTDLLEQAQMLADRMKRDGSINFAKDWKVITVFIGGNDLCHFCEDEDKFSADMYTERVGRALDYLRDTVPRAFVNLVKVLNVEMAQQLATTLFCDLVHKFVCTCVNHPKSESAFEKLRQTKSKYQQQMDTLVSTGRYDTKEDFTVVVQPFYVKTFTPMKGGKPDMSYFTKDCFHQSQKGQEAAAAALWNNMVEPVGAKRTSWTPGEKLVCPTQEKPYFYTYKNSWTMNN